MYIWQQIFLPSFIHNSASVNGRNSAANPVDPGCENSRKMREKRPEERAFQQTPSTSSHMKNNTNRQKNTPQHMEKCILSMAVYALDFPERFFFCGKLPDEENNLLRSPSVGGTWKMFRPGVQIKYARNAVWIFRQGFFTVIFHFFLELHQLVPLTHTHSMLLKEIWASVKARHSTFLVGVDFRKCLFSISIVAERVH